MKPSASGLVSIADMMVADSCLVASKLAFLLSEMRKWNISVAVESDIWNNYIEYSHLLLTCVLRHGVHGLGHADVDPALELSLPGDRLAVGDLTRARAPCSHTR